MIKSCTFGPTRESVTRQNSIHVTVRGVLRDSCLGWLSGTVDEAEARADAVLAFEDRVANVSWTNVQRRDPVATYNPMDVAALEAAAPGFHWKIFLDSAGPFPNDVLMVIGCLSGVVGIAKEVNNTDLEVLKAWTAFHVTKGAAPYMSSRFVNTSFQFNKKLSGQEVLSARWKRGVRFVNGHMGMEVGKAYVKKHFPPSSKDIVRELTLNIGNAFKTRIENLDWMTSATKKKAVEKLSSIGIKVGYPDKWRDYSSLEGQKRLRHPPKESSNTNMDTTPPHRRQDHTNQFNDIMLSHHQHHTTARLCDMATRLSVITQDYRITSPHFLSQLPRDMSVFTGLICNMVSSVGLHIMI